MDTEIQGDVYVFLSGERVNVELLFKDDVDMGVLITARLRPWKNQPHDGEMILAGGLSVDEALFYAVKSLLREEWLPLEWSQRARVPGKYVRDTDGTSSSNATRRTKLLSKALFSDHPIGNTATSEKMSQNGLETHTGQVDLKLLRRGAKP